MPEYEMVLRAEGKPSQRYQVPRTGLRIGRSSQNDIRLTSQLVSRFHAVVRLEGPSLYVEDLDSSNGIEVNGKPLKSGLLAEGDKLLVGDTLFQVVKKSDSSIGRTVIGPDNAEALHAEMLREGGAARLRLLYEAANLLGTVFDIDELLRRILELLFSALPVRRGFVLTIASNSSAPEIRAALSREAGENGPPLSHTLIRHVFDSREAMLTTDAQTDSRFAGTDSIVGYDIHSAMCAPLFGRSRAVIGALYVDSGTSSCALSRDDLEVLTAIARVVGVAVENARLHSEAVARERLAAIGQATAGLGHCVKNILTGIRGGAEFVNMAIEKQDIKCLERGWPILSRSIERIDLLVMNMLSFSKDRVPERTPTDLNMLVNDVFDLLRARAQRHNVELVFEPTGPSIVSIDGRQIYRVILNLVVNALDACVQRGGRIEVSCEMRRSGCVLRIVDTGPGIPEELLPRIFEAFVTGKGGGGTGLGLACSQKIVREHEGDIEVRNTPNQGACFSVFLPHDPHATAPPRG
jgi:signal transduction histidine kinase